MNPRSDIKGGDGDRPLTVQTRATLLQQLETALGDTTVMTTKQDDYATTAGDDDLVMIVVW